MEPRIIFEDNHLIVLSKPAGLLSQGEHKGDPNLVDWLRKYLGREYVGLVHRLDRNTSGIMVIAKRTKSAERLTRALQEGKIDRTYLAWLEGNLADPRRWKHHLFKDQAKNVVHVVTHSHPRGKEAVLSVTPKEHGEWHGFPVTLAEFRLETGRSHQIRVQCAHEGFPILGDEKYARKSSLGKGAPSFGRPALHSHRIRFPHPMRANDFLEFEDPLPSDMAALIRKK